MDNINSNGESYTATALAAAAHWCLEEGRQLAVIAGEGQGWMARVLATRVGAPETVYWVRLADGRRMVKLAGELAELTGADAGEWPVARKQLG